MDRPPLDQVQQVTLYRDARGHVWPKGDCWTYPCLGCGLEGNTGLASLPCPRPYSDPKGVEVLLTEIRDLLLILVNRRA